MPTRTRTGETTPQPPPGSQALSDTAPWRRHGLASSLSATSQLTGEVMDGNLPGDSQAFIAASRWGLDEVIDVYGRALGAFARIEASTECCFPDELHAELEAARAAARRATHALARLPVDEATDLERRLRLVERALEI